MLNSVSGGIFIHFYPHTKASIIQTNAQILLGFLKVVSGVNVHPFDSGPMGNLQGGQAMGKVRLSKQNS